MGKITDTGRMVVKDSKTGEAAVNLDLDELSKKTLMNHASAVLQVLHLLMFTRSSFTTGCASLSVAPCHWRSNTHNQALRTPFAMKVFMIIRLWEVGVFMSCI